MIGLLGSLDVAFLVVLHDGEFMEQGSINSILTPPHHSYTQQLLSSVPELRTDWLDNITSSDIWKIVKRLSLVSMIFF